MAAEMRSQPRSMTASPDLFLGLSERQFQATVIAYAQRCGWLVCWTWRSIHSPAGEPDLRLLRGDRYILAELKTERGQLSPAQVAYGEAARACPAVEYYVWRPRDWRAIEEVLR